MNAPDPDAPIRLAEAPGAPAGSGDPSRRWALVFTDGAHRFPGVTRPEGEAAAAELARTPPDGWDAALVEVVLAVVLSDGAGPYLLDAAGRITLVLAAHPALEGVHLAMGEPVPDHRIGLVRRRSGGPVWEWIARAEVPPEGRVVALDGLDALTDPADAGEWERVARR